MSCATSRSHSGPMGSAGLSGWRRSRSNRTSKSGVPPSTTSSAILITANSPSPTASAASRTMVSCRPSHFTASPAARRTAASPPRITSSDEELQKSYPYCLSCFCLTFSTPPTPPASSHATACAPIRCRSRSSPSAPCPSCRRRPPAALVVPRELEVEALVRHADGDVPDASPPFRFGCRSLLLIAAKSDSMSVVVASEIPRTRG
jgi:hypothetical protein